MKGGMTRAEGEMLLETKRFIFNGGLPNRRSVSAVYSSEAVKGSRSPGFHRERRRSLAKASLILITLLFGLANDVGTSRGDNCNSAEYSSRLIAFRITACLQSSVITRTTAEEMRVRLVNIGTTNITIVYSGYLMGGEIYNSTGFQLRYIHIPPPGFFYLGVELGPGRALNDSMQWLHEKGGSDGEVVDMNRTSLYYVDAFLDGWAYPANLTSYGNYTINEPKTPIMPYWIVDAQLLPFNDYQAITLGLLGFIAVVLTVLLIIVVKRNKPRPQENTATREVAGES